MLILTTPPYLNKHNVKDGSCRLENVHYIVRALCDMQFMVYDKTAPVFKSA